ncbi:site-specific integrase [Algibacter amylolyticus]|uniref:site-specific integrase n=1 Tax=Algibacter amylolyticus TaxID=1608400 RepID=UPI001845A14A|nr:site-specific integrase [Algibacter amylolyticus]MBB5268929.1 integrase [Algibacter amylolyticus]
MSSVKAVLRTKPNSQKLFPIAIRIIKDRKTSFLYTGQYIHKNQWDQNKGQVKKSHPDALNINQLIFKKLSKANRGLLEAEIKDEYLSSISIKNKVIKTHSGEFFNVAKIYLKNIENRNKSHQLAIEYKRIEVFKEFLERDKLFFNDLNIELLKKFENYLIIKLNLSRRTMVNYMITIRTIFNLAIRNSFTDIKLYPFGKGKYSIKFPETKKIGLNTNEITLLENIQNITVAQKYALSAWLLSFYFAGIRVSDVLQLKWEDFLDNRLYYRMNKNGKLVSLKVPEKVQNILDRLERDKNSIYLFKELEGVNISDNKRLRTRIKTATRNFNRRLEIVAEKAGIDKKTEHAYSKT